MAGQLRVATAEPKMMKRKWDRKVEARSKALTRKAVKRRQSFGTNSSESPREKKKAEKRQGERKGRKALLTELALEQRC